MSIHLLFTQPPDGKSGNKDPRSTGKLSDILDMSQRIGNDWLSEDEEKKIQIQEKIEQKQQNKSSRRQK